jgi:hypothetical protein
MGLSQRNADVSITYEVVPIGKQVDTINFKDKFVDLSKLSQQVAGAVSTLEKGFQTIGKSSKIIPTKGGFIVDQFLNLDQFQKQVEMTGNRISNGFESIKPKLKQKSQDIGNIIASETINFEKVQKAWDKKEVLETTQYNKALTRNEKFARQSEDSFNRLNRLLDKTSNKTVPFAGWAMSLMFLGMALQRVFDTIWKSSTKTFQDAMHSVEGTVTQFDILNGSVAYLQFNIGNALEPIVSFLIPIIDKVSDWVNQNEGLVTLGMTILGISAAVFAVGGSFKLAIDGLSGFLLKLGLIKTEIALMGALQVGVALVLAMDAYDAFKNGEVLDGVSSAMIAGGFLAMAGGKGTLGGALVGIGIALEFVDALVKGGGKLTPSSLSDFLIKAGSLGMFVFPPVGAALLTIGVALKFLPGDFAEKFTLMMGILFGILAQVVAGVIDAILYPIRLIINGLIVAYNLVTKGKDLELLSMFGTSSAAYDRLQNQIDQFKEIMNPEATYGTGNKYDVPYAQQYYNPQQSSAGVNNYYVEINGMAADEMMQKTIAAWAAEGKSSAMPR